MAENDTGEKTESPSGKRLGQAREQGQVPRSQDLSQVLSISTAFLMIQSCAPTLWEKLGNLCKISFTSQYGTQPWTLETLRYKFIQMVVYLAPEIILILFVTAFVGAFSTLLQTNFNYSNKLLKPKFSHLNPISGIKRIFSLNNSIQLLKSVVKLAIIAPIAYTAFIGFFPQMVALMNLPVTQFLPFTSMAMSEIFWKIMKFLLTVGILDYSWNYYKVNRDLKMTKVEVKEEKKATEGDEATRYKIRMKAIARVRERMMKNVKTADVVVTNPTHLAVALKYTMKKGSAPQVVAKGRGFIAERIKEIAREEGIPVVERKPLARALYQSVEVGHDIPFELYSAVAEVLAYVYRLKGRNPFRAAQRQ